MYTTLYKHNFLVRFSCRLFAGNDAENYLLADAELLYYASPQKTLYRKRGSAVDAARDFRLLNEMRKPDIAQRSDRVSPDLLCIDHFNLTS